MIYTHVQRKDLVNVKSPLDVIVEQRLNAKKELLAGKERDK
jgi:hypothetical protein